MLISVTLVYLVYPKFFTDLSKNKYLNRVAKLTIKINSSPEKDFAIASCTENPWLSGMENYVLDSL
jgi:hypothetical protein